MKKIKKETVLTVGIVLLVILIVFLILTTKGKEKEKIEEVTPSPTPTEEPFHSDTGARYISPTKEEQDEIDQVKKLRKMLPLKESFFTMSFDYKLTKFLVTFNEKNTDNEEKFKSWIIENNYNKIPFDYFAFENK